jgi:pimeloyl-ACP methyl ester carboxylesterase
VANGRFLNMLIPNSELVVIKGGGHLFMLSHVAETIAEMRRFLDSDAEDMRKAA